MLPARTVVLALAASAMALLASPRVAIAQPSGQDAATAQALFDEGKKLMGAGKHAEACPKLVESQRLDPGGGTLFAIALCHEGEGKTATAWADFSMALAEARKDRRADREAAAAEHVRVLVPKLTRVRVAPVSKTAGLEIRRDGTRVGDAQWGIPLPVDPGQHLFEATAPGKTGWRQIVDVQGEGATIDVSVPPLADDPASGTAAIPAPVSTPEQPREPVAADDTGISQRTWAIVAGGVGVAAAGIGLGFGLAASSKWNDADKACPGGRCADPAKVTEGEDAGRTADLATVLVVVGGIGIATGVLLWLTAPSGDSKRAVRVLPHVTTQGLGISIGGAL